MQIQTTMRYDPERDAVWIWPDRREPYLASRNVIEGLARGAKLTEDELLAACREHEARLAALAARKYEQREIDPDGRVVVTTMDVNA